MPRQHLTLCFGSGQCFCTVGARLQPILHRKTASCVPSTWEARRQVRDVGKLGQLHLRQSRHPHRAFGSHGPGRRRVPFTSATWVTAVVRSPLTASPPARGTGSRAQFRPGLIVVRRRLRQTMAFPSGRLRAWLADCCAPFFKSLLGVTIIAGSTRNGLGGRSTTAAVSDRHCIPCDYPRRSVTIAGTAVSRAETGRRPFLC